MTQADLLINLRTLASDTATSNSIRQEAPIGKTDGANTNFRLQNWPVVAASMYLTNGASFRSQSGFTLDPTTGIFVMGTAPTSAVSPWEADYCFYWFSDTDHVVFLTQAASFLGSTDMTSVDPGLIPALLHFALQQFWMRRSSQYAHRYASSGGTAGHSVDVVTKAFLDLAKTAEAKATTLRDDFYKRQGQRNAPSSGTQAYRVDPYTPRR